MASTIQFYDPSAKTSLEPSEPSTTLENILATWSDRKLEARHDYIQHLFPLPERSPVNPDAPVITKDVRQAFLQKEELRVGMLKALQRMGRFYGFEMKDDGTFEQAANFPDRAADSWLTTMDHNHLRITRIIRCLRILGLTKHAHTFLFALLSADEEAGRVCSKNSLTFWCRAALRPLKTPPSYPREPEVKWLNGEMDDADEVEQSKIAEWAEKRRLDV